MKTQWALPPFPLALISTQRKDFLHFSYLKNLGARSCASTFSCVSLPGAAALANTVSTGLGDLWTHRQGFFWTRAQELHGRMIHLPQPQRSVSLSRAVWTPQPPLLLGIPEISWPAGGVTASHHTGFPAGRARSHNSRLTVFLNFPPSFIHLAFSETLCWELSVCNTESTPKSKLLKLTFHPLDLTTCIACLLEKARC